jgi:hypothetical protein
MVSDWKLDEKTPMMSSKIELQMDEWFVEGLRQAHLDFKSGEDNSDRYGDGTSAALWYGRGYSSQSWLSNKIKAEKELQELKIHSLTGDQT